MTKGAWFGSMIPPADPDRAGDIPDHYRCRGTRDAHHIVVLGEPEPPVAASLHVPRKVKAMTQRISGRCSLDDRGEIRTDSETITAHRDQWRASLRQVAGPFSRPPDSSEIQVAGGQSGFALGPLLADRPALS